jgi:hypothetical protein
VARRDGGRGERERERERERPVRGETDDSRVYDRARKCDKMLFSGGQTRREGIGRSAIAQL